MNGDDQLKLQAWLDGELSDREAAQVKEWASTDPEAQSLLAELRNTKSALTGHEAGVKLPESGDFFWSKIRREINRQETERERAPEPRVPWWTLVSRKLAPATIVALLVLMAGIWLIQPEKAAPVVGEMELASDNMGAYTYRDQTERMTVVWFYNKDDSQFTQPPIFASISGR